MLPLRWFLGRWLRGQAQAKAAEVVRDAAAQSVRSASTSATDQPQRADMVVLFALKLEEEALVRHLSEVVTHSAAGRDVHLGRAGDKRVVAAATGPGQESATRVATAIIKAHQPSLVVASGLAAGLDASLRRNDVVMASEVVHEQHPGLRIVLPSQPPQTVSVGRLLTVDRVLRLPSEKEQLGTKFAALAADMESYHIAQICAQAGIPFLAVRVISDAMQDELPADVERLLRQKSLASKAGAVTGTLFRRPGSIGDLWRLKEMAYTAADRLAKSLVELLFR